MIHDVVGVGIVLMLCPLSLLVLYQWVLAGASYFYRPPTVVQEQDSKHRFLVLIPAHNEEAGIASTLKSLAVVEYPSQLIHILVVADRCNDGTATVSRTLGATCFERHVGEAGKGAAIAWGLQQAKNMGVNFDAVIIIDADTVADTGVLSAFNSGLNAKHYVQQGYNYISNPWASAFTRIIAVTSLLRNGLYYAGKSALGLHGMLTGTGMCLAASVLERFGWSAFSVGEDWEFSVELLLGGEQIYFNPMAKTFAQESQSLNQASRQRLRWASGRYAVMGKKVFALVREGIRLRSLAIIDSAITLVAPNYSSQAALTIFCVLGAWLNLEDATMWSFTLGWASGLLLAIVCYFGVGIVSTEAPAKALAGLILVPLFLPWRITIELLGVLGYGRRNWGRMSRTDMSSHEINQ